MEEPQMCEPYAGDALIEKIFTTSCDLCIETMIRLTHLLNFSPVRIFLKFL
jgi:hypothetical protein